MAEKSIWLGGFHPVQALLETHPERIYELYVQRDRDDARMQALREQAQACGLNVQAVAPRWFKDNQPQHRVAVHQGVVARAQPVKPLDEAGLMTLLDRKTTEQPPLLLVLDGVTDPHNLGACMRTAQAAGADAVIVPKDRACGLTQAARKASAGASERLALVEVTNLARTLTTLAKRGVWLVGTAMDTSVSLYQTRFATEPVALIMGAEDRGMRRLTRERVDELVAIPMVGEMESLNVSVACGVCLFEFRRQRLMAE